MLEIGFPKFGLLLYQNCLAILAKFWNPFPTWIEVSISYLNKKTQETIFLEFQRLLRLVCSL